MQLYASDIAAFCIQANETLVSDLQTYLDWEITLGESPTLYYKKRVTHRVTYDNISTSTFSILVRYVGTTD